MLLSWQIIQVHQRACLPACPPAVLAHARAPFMSQLTVNEFADKTAAERNTLNGVRGMRKVSSPLLLLVPRLPVAAWGSCWLKAAYVCALRRCALPRERGCCCQVQITCTDLADCTHIPPFLP